MKKTRKSIGIFFVSLVLVSLFASTAFAATVQHSFSLNIQSMTSGTNYHPYAKGSCRITATARTIDPWDGSEQFKVALKKTFTEISTSSYYVADGFTRTQSVTLPSTADYYPRVWLKRNNSGSPTYVKGSGYTSQNM